MNEQSKEAETSEQMCEDCERTCKTCARWWDAKPHPEVGKIVGRCIEGPRILMDSAYLCPVITKMDKLNLRSGSSLRTVYTPADYSCPCHTFDIEKPFTAQQTGSGGVWCV